MPSAVNILRINEDNTVTGGCTGTWIVSPTDGVIHTDHIEAVFSGTLDDAGLLTFRVELYFTKSATPNGRIVTINDVYEGQLQVSGTFVDFFGRVYGPPAQINSLTAGNARVERQLSQG